MSSTHLSARRPPLSLADANPFAVATYVFSAVLGTLGMLLLPERPLLTLAVAAVLCGWSESDGLCGISHISSLTPLRRIRSPAFWRKAVTVYTVAGVVTGSAAGALIGAVGAVTGVQALNTYTAIAFVTGVLVLIVREIGWIRFRLPQVNLQTVKMWATEFGWIPAATMWGAHIGMGFATVIKHGGYFMLLSATVLLGPLKGSALLVIYWLGRALAMWTAPLLVAPEVHGNGSALGRMVAGSSTSFRWAAITGLLCGGTASVVLFLH